MYIFNLHWDKVDNYRIDKYLMFLRFQLNEALKMVKENAYDKEIVLNWFSNQLKKVLYLEENTTSKGIPLQLCDVFLTELNKVDAENISYVDLSGLLQPFLETLGNSANRIIV
jgi:ribosomal RNA-processing protein 1